jgi:7,8-dihydropterin-6-yl-methyl-4-(beta-D-ribofuranosyl)aminobenzene 5'-phosphate synthase
MVAQFESTMLTIAIVYDNYGYDPTVRAGSGFACIVKTDTETILFDTGTHGPTLFYNMEKLGFAPEGINTIVISHIDNDHIGGLFSLLEKNWEVTVYVPQSFPPAFKDLIALHQAKVVEVAKPREICPNVETSGELGTWIKEQLLILQTEKGIVLILGDAHSGIINALKKVKNIVTDRIYLVLGGFSLSGSSGPSELGSIVENFVKLGIKKVAPCHSNGDMARRLFQERYKENYIESGVGRVIQVV